MEVQEGEHSNARLFEGKVCYLLHIAGFTTASFVWLGLMIQSCMRNVGKNTYRSERNLDKLELERK